MEGGLEKIQTLEDSLTRTRDEKVTEEKGKAPVFTVPLSNIDSLREGESAHFEGRLIPTDDPKLKVEWFWNGKPLRTGSRFRTFCDFGFVILEISPVYPEDSGEYSCRAFNDYGEAVTIASMKVQGKRSIILESQLPKGMEGTIDKIAELEGLGVVPSQATPDDDSGKPPEFITTPSDLTLGENSLAHFECKLIPVNDQSMRVEWFHNGKALWAGSRIKTINDFGFVILEVSGVYQRDSGLYTCKATNRHGEATVSCKLQVRGRQGIILEPQLPSNFRSGTESIQKLEGTNKRLEHAHRLVPQRASVRHRFQSSPNQRFRFHLVGYRLHLLERRRRVRLQSHQQVGFCHDQSDGHLQVQTYHRLRLSTAGRNER
jgi:titin